MENFVQFIIRFVFGLGAFTTLKQNVVALETKGSFVQQKTNKAFAEEQTVYQESKLVIIHRYWQARGQTSDCGSTNIKHV